MKKIIKFILIVLFFLYIYSIPVKAEVVPDEILISMRKSAVSIFSTRDMASSRCSGTVVKEYTHGVGVLTAKHCVGEFEEVYIDNIRVISITVSPDDDLAYFRTVDKIPGKEPIIFAQKETIQNDIVYHLGFPNLKEYIRVGKIALITEDSQYINMSVIPGCSGGGLWNDKGEYVGVVWGTYGFGPDALSIFEPLDDVIKFLKDIGEWNE